MDDVFDMLYDFVMGTYFGVYEFLSTCSIFELWLYLVVFVLFIVYCFLVILGIFGS